ncbi:Hypothetical predicted protein [Octopus vulgaris]|uniref:Uncharacterized protein n=1 Tax=Octopus vulgaris TaxID=6645 RepID=A0AA36FCW8_OCTVU|nr:Hypothetical predicted protein [Octopus vulgaris]
MKLLLVVTISLFIALVVGTPNIDDIKFDIVGAKTAVSSGGSAEKRAFNGGPSEGGSGNDLKALEMKEMELN